MLSRLTPHFLLVGLIVQAIVARDVMAQAVFDCVAPTAPNPTNPVALGNGSPGSVTTAMIQNALDVGGAIRINAGSGTIALDATLLVTRDAVLDLGGATLSGGGTRRVVEVRNPSNLTYTFVLQHGAIAAGSTTGASGAGLFKDTGGPWQVVTIRVFDVDFNDNHAIAVSQDGGGGAVYITGAAELSIADSTFNGNAGSNGGALYSLVSQRVNLYDTEFNGNVATGSGGNPGNGGNGGAIGVDGGVDGEPRYLNLCRVRLIDNQSNAFGAGLFTVTYSGESSRASGTRPCKATSAAPGTNSPAAHTSRAARSRSAAVHSATTPLLVIRVLRCSDTAACSKARL